MKMRRQDKKTGQGVGTGTYGWPNRKSLTGTHTAGSRSAGLWHRNRAHSHPSPWQLRLSVRQAEGGEGNGGADGKGGCGPEFSAGGTLVGDRTRARECAHTHTHTLFLSLSLLHTHRAETGGKVCVERWPSLSLCPHCLAAVWRKVDRAHSSLHAQLSGTPLQAVVKMQVCV